MWRRPLPIRFRSRPASVLATAASVLASLCLAAAGVQAQEAGDAGEAAQGKGGDVVQAGSQVAIEYTLTLEDGEKVDSNVGGEAMRFEQGSGQIIPGLDKQLLGMAVGETKHVTVSAEEGYGPVDPEAFRQVPISQLPEDAREPGTQLVAEDSEGHRRPLRVHSVEGDTATLDFNHPLAGKTLIFDVKILEVD